MSNGSSSWRVEAYGGPALSFWFVVFALALVLAASAWWVRGIDASQASPALADPAATLDASDTPNAAPAPKPATDVAGAHRHAGT